MKKHAVSWVEIPAANLKRARTFYETLFGVEMHTMTLENGLKMALFPVEEGGVGAALCEHEKFYRPGYEGPLVYLSGDPDLQQILGRVDEAGGKILVPKTQISDEYGFMAVFEDCEGNRVALRSKK